MTRLFKLLTLLIASAFFLVSIVSAAKPDQTGKPVSPGKSLKVKAKGNKLEITEVEITDEGEEEDEGEPEITDQVEIDDEEGDGEGDTTIKANGNAAVVIKNKIQAQTNFPLRVNTETNELIVITPNGSKIVTILPDAAVRNMLAANVIDELGGKGGFLFRLENPEPTATASAEPSPTSTASAEPSPTASGSAETTEEGTFSLTTDEEGELVYRVAGKKFKKLFGIFNITIDKVVVLSAETGNIKGIEKTLFEQIQEILSTE